jgi:hypothetical protein
MPARTAAASSGLSTYSSRQMRPSRMCTMTSVARDVRLVTHEQDRHATVTIEPPP